MNSLKSTGFTLIEMMMVIVIMSILMVSAYMRWPGRSINLGGQAAQLANDIRYTQSLAMAKGQRYRFVITSSSAYQIQNGSGTAILNAVGATTTPLNTGITFGTATNLPNNLIAFDGKGIPYTDTAVPGTALAATATIPLTTGGVTETVSIAAQTGLVSVS